MKPISPTVRFWKKVSGDRNEHECWQWIGARTGSGYGNFVLSGIRGREQPIPAHRFSYILHRGPIPEGLHLDHLCRNRFCVNPAHLEPVTCGENLRRGMHPNMLAKLANTCTKGHEITGDNVIQERRKDVSLRFRCKLCARLREQRRKS